MKRPATSPRRVGEAGGGDPSTSGRAVPGSRRRPRRLPRPSDCAYRALAKHLPVCLESAPRFRVWSRGRPRDSLGPHWQLAPPLPGLGFCPPPCSLLRLGNRGRRALAATLTSCGTVATALRSTRRAPRPTVCGLPRQPSEAPAASATALGPAPCLSAGHSPPKFWERPYFTETKTEAQREEITC